MFVHRIKYAYIQVYAFRDVSRYILCTFNINRVDGLIHQNSLYAIEQFVVNQVYTQSNNVLNQVHHRIIIQHTHCTTLHDTSVNP